MSTSTRNARKASATPAVDNTQAPITEAPTPQVNTPAPPSVVIPPAAPAVETPAVIIPLAQRGGDDIFTVLEEYALHVYTPAVSALFVVCKGDSGKVLALLGENSPLAPRVHVCAEVLSVLNKTAPREMFEDTFTNTAGVKIGDIYASAVGLSALYRAQTRADIKHARENARKFSSK